MITVRMLRKGSAESLDGLLLLCIPPLPGFVVVTVLIIESKLRFLLLRKSGCGQAKAENGQNKVSLHIRIVLVIV